MLHNSRGIEYFFYSSTNKYANISKVSFNIRYIRTYTHMYVCQYVHACIYIHTYLHKCECIKFGIVSSNFKIAIRQIFNSGESEILKQTGVPLSCIYVHTYICVYACGGRGRAKLEIILCPRGIISTTFMYIYILAQDHLSTLLDLLSSQKISIDVNI